jgi:hypothetical protein
VATECSCHYLSIIPGIFGSCSMSYPCDSGQGPHLFAISHCFHPSVEQEVLQLVKVLLVSVYWYGVVSYKASLALWTFSDL